MEWLSKIFNVYPDYLGIQTPTIPQGSTTTPAPILWSDTIPMQQAMPIMTMRVC
jgi:hypothetical protein